ncbi:hypothetical protein LTR10_005267 [Elasticomyces elasticus]|nr:hypothetical protein LTR10_005267 [Elasticomyces elasticus]KAK4976004.1 hypothetical protein LTR42_003629 [Elasticomyces elasticus]
MSGRASSASANAESVTRPLLSGHPSQPKEGPEAARLRDNNRSTSLNTSITTNDQNSTTSMSSKASSSRSSQATSVTSESTQSPQQTGERRKSSLGGIVGKAKAKLSRHPGGAEALADDEEDFQRQKAKEVEKQKRKEEYERLGLGDRTKYGMGGAGGWTG